ncbi:MAG TPA: DUF4474 domain-containing protein [Papillibacter sp.]|jgi:hypothetical protein|nr:DUF4474 domain-containing protein [Papillibacter sp.]
MGVMVTVLVRMPEFWIFIAALCVSCVVLAVFLWRMEWELMKTRAPVKKKGSGDKPGEGAAACLTEMGFDYDSSQDILVSRKDAWQRRYGYCRLYDEAAAPCGMILHCEPVAFEFEGRHWLLALWKGQYGLSVGAEMGLYYTDRPDVSVSDLYTGPYYACVPEEEWPVMMMTLFHRDSALFTLEERHWWLAGHRPGLYAPPEDMALRGSVTFKSVEMAQAVYNALFNVGYTPWEIGRVDETVFVTFTRPHTTQPDTQKGLFAWMTRIKLRRAARLYARAVRNLSGMEEVLGHLQAKAPKLYAALHRSIRGRGLLTAHGPLRNLNVK